MRGWFRQGPSNPAAAMAYDRIVAQARLPAFYLRFGVPDSLNGRFEMLTLHLFLVLHRLGRERDRSASAELSQALVDMTMADLDGNLREMGAGDLGVGRRVKNMAGAIYERIGAYGAALEGQDPALEPALARYVYGTAAPAPSPDRLADMAGYVRQCRDLLAAHDRAALSAGNIAFSTPPAGPGSG